MKEFYKWLDTQLKDKHDTIKEIEMFDLGAKLSWKAALEWVKKRMDDNLNSVRREDIVDVYKMIEKELNNE